jgi:hypothetical protein
MSFIHLDKSVITFHFKEILEDGHLGGPLTLVSLGALLLGPTLLSSRSTSATVTPTPRRSASPYRPGVSLSEWVQQQQTVSAEAEHRPTLSVANRAQESDGLAA